MSLFFTGERKIKTVVPELIPDWEKALDAVAKRQNAEYVAAVGNISVEQAHDLRKMCREVERKLLLAIQDSTVKTQTEATTFIRDNTVGFFPAAKFISQLKDNLGKTTYTIEQQEDPITHQMVDVQVPVFTPATWTEVKTAALTEEA